MIMSLLYAPVGKKVKVINIVGGFGLQRRLYALGIVPGKLIKKVIQYPFGGPIIIEIGGTRFAIGRGMAAKIMVEVS